MSFLQITKMKLGIIQYQIKYKASFVKSRLKLRVCLLFIFISQNDKKLLKYF